MAPKNPAAAKPSRSAHASANAVKETLHARNLHRQRYDFAALGRAFPPLVEHVQVNRYGDESVDFANPLAVKALNHALLAHHYGVTFWDLPAGYLCPPIPSRVDHLHHLADLLADSNGGEIPTGPSVTVVDVGVGANCIYPLLGNAAYGWEFVGVDVDPVALENAARIVARNSNLKGHVDLRLQRDARQIFQDVLGQDEDVDATMCNPPFHASAAEAQERTERKVRNLTGTHASKPVLNFGGTAPELWCDGGETGFVRRMVQESARMGNRCLWFTSLISRATTLPAIHASLDAEGALDVRTVEMLHGQKKSRLVAWTFQTPEQHEAWAKRRWS